MLLIDTTMRNHHYVFPKNRFRFFIFTTINWRRGDSPIRDSQSEKGRTEHSHTTAVWSTTQEHPHRSSSTASPVDWYRHGSVGTVWFTSVIRNAIHQVIGVRSHGFFIRYPRRVVALPWNREASGRSITTKNTISTKITLLNGRWKVW